MIDYSLTLFYILMVVVNIIIAIFRFIHKLFSSQIINLKICKIASENGNIALIMFITTLFFLLKVSARFPRTKDDHVICTLQSISSHAI